MVNPLVKSHPNGKAVGTVIDPISIVAIAVPEPAVLSGNWAAISARIWARVLMVEEGVIESRWRSPRKTP